VHNNVQEASSALGGASEKVFSGHGVCSDWVSVIGGSRNTGLEPTGERMKRIGAILLLVVLLAACSQQVVPNGGLEAEANYWQQIGGAVANGDLSSLALSSFEDPIVAYRSYESGIATPTLRVKYWNGQAWKQLGKNLDFGGYSISGKPSLTLDKDKNPIVAWSESYSSSYTLYVALWTGEWSLIGSPVDTSITSAYDQISLATDTSGYPVVSWLNNNQVFVKRWNGQKWVSLGGALNASNALGSKVSMILDSNGNPSVAWSQFMVGFPDSFRVLVKQWNGSKWLSLGAVNPGSKGLTFDISLTLNATGQPLVAWSQIARTPLGITSGNVYVKQWSGNQWVQLGSILDVKETYDADMPSITMGTNNNPVIAWSEGSTLPGYKLYVKRWTGQKWVLVGTNPINVSLKNNAYFPSIASIGGRVAVSWYEGNSIYFKRYRTNVWQP
jgi:hypothetical protein